MEIRIQFSDVYMEQLTAYDSAITPSIQPRANMTKQ